MERFDELLDTSNTVDTEESYRDMLRNYYSDCLKGPFECLDPAELLEMADPTAYRCGHVDYIDSQEWTEYNGETYETSYLEDIREQVESELGDELYELETELADMPQLANTMAFAEVLARRAEVKARVAAIRSEIETLWKLF